MNQISIIDEELVSNETTYEMRLENIYKRKDSRKIVVFVCLVFFFLAKVLNNKTVHLIFFSNFAQFFCFFFNEN